MADETTGRRTLVEDVQWVRGRARFEDGAIVLDQATLRDYPIFEEGADEAPWKLAAIKDPQDAVDFVRRFGLLRSGRGTDLREPWSDWESTVRDVQLILAMAQDLRTSGWGDIEAITRIRALSTTPEFAALWKAAAKNDEERRMQLGAWVAGRVSLGLADTPFRLRSQAEIAGGNAGAPDIFVYSPHPPDLLGAVYWKLAQLLTSGRPMRRCEGCGVMFLVRDERQRFHDKQCAQRARYRRAAEKRRQGA